MTSVSAGLFQIVGALQMSVPNDTTPVQWRINSSGNEIKWNATGSIANVKLEYSTNGGTSWSTVIASTPSGAGNDKSYAWTIPSNATITNGGLRFRVLDAANTNISDTADAASSLLANFAITAPVLGNVWVAENTQTIQWSTPQAGVPANVKIEYDLGGGWQNLPETDGTANDGIVTNSGSRNWTLGTTLTTSAKIRISDPANASSIMVSDPFKIRGSLTMTAPNTGTESWEVGTTNNITWTKKGAITAVKLELSTAGDDPLAYEPLVDDNGLDTQNIDVSGAGPYTFAWKVPNQPGITTTAARIRVVDASDPTVYDPANANFTVKGRVQLSTPNGGENLIVGNPFAVTGTVFGPISSVKLYYSKNGGATYDFPMEGCETVAVSTGAFSCNWSVPDIIGSNLSVKVTDANNALVNDVSDAVFSVKGSVTLTAPVSGNVWTAGSVNNIVWDRTGTIGNVDLFYNVNNGSWNTIASGVASPLASGNSFAWTVPTSNIVSANVKVKIDSPSLLSSAVSSSFTVKGSLTLTYPDAAGIDVTLGDTMNVTWNVAGNIGNVKVEYYDGTAWSTITSSAPEAGPFALLLDAPNTTAATAAAKVRISDADDATVFDTSANDFLVRPFLQVTSPAGGEAWVVDSTHNITWNKIGSNVANVKIEYSTDSGATYPNAITLSTANDGTHPWLIPDNIQNVKNMKIKMSSLPTSDPWAVTALSTGLFQIVGALQMAVPNDTTPVLWRAGSSANEIKWDATGSIANVKLEYSTNGGTSWSTVVASTPSGAGAGKSYGWNIPSNVALTSGNFRIRVLDAANTNVFDVADAASSMMTDFTITAPIAGNVWQAENTHTITWSTPQAGVPANVKIEYNLNDGNGWQPIAETSGTANDGIVTNTGSQNWTLGTGISASAKIRISDSTNAQSAVESNPFKIRGSLTVTAPNNLESWEIGTINNITWTKKGNISAVKLELSTAGDDPAQYEAMVDADGKDTQNIDVSGAGPYTFAWKIPDQAGINTVNARVRITDVSDPTVLDQSNGDFTIKGRVQLSNPNGGETLTVGVPAAVNGTVFGPIPSVDLYYSINGGTTYDYPVEGCATVATSAGNFSCNWNVPDRVGPNVRIKAVDSGNPLVFDTSDANFAIKGSVTITAPVSGNIWYAGDTNNIVWDRTGTIGNVDLYYNVNGGAWTTIASGIASPLLSGNSFTWSVPTDQIVSANVKVKIDGANLVAPSVSNAFTVKGKLILSYPDAAGIDRSLGDNLTVTWTVAGDIGNVKVEYYDGTAWSTISTTAPQAGPYTFVLDAPNTTAATATARVRISDADDATVTDTSANDFMVRPLLAVTSPAGAEEWVVATTQNITWNHIASNVANVKIEYSKDSGVTYPDVIASSTANDGTHPWLIPDDIQTIKNMRIKISSLPTTDVWAVAAFSQGFFQIIGALQMVTPNDSTGVKWRVGTAQDIKWNATGSIANVKLEYSSSGSGGPWTTLVASAPSGAGTNKSYTWTIPINIPFVKDNFRIRVLDALNTNVFDVADASSSILGDFTITAPVAGNVWQAENTHTITWATPQAGVPATVKIEYDLNDGNGYLPIAETFGTANDGVVSNSGSQNWTLPVGLSAAARIRVSDPADIDSARTSDPFKIRGRLTLTAPNGLESWEIDTLHDITWTKKGNIAAVKLEISTAGDDPAQYEALVDADGKDTQNIDTTGAGPYTFNWKIPNQAGITTINGRIRIVDATDSTVLDQSNGDFTIKGRVQVLTPNGGNSLTVGVPYAVTGSVFGPIANVNLYYSTNGGATYDYPVEGCATVAVSQAAFSCNWNVPDIVGLPLRIKAVDANNPVVFDTSDSNFAVKGGATLTSPTSSSVWIAGEANNITWDRTGNIGNVDLYYSVNDGPFNTITTSVPSPLATGNSFSWVLPTTAIVSNNVKVKIDGANLVGPNVTQAFAVKGKLTLTYPDAAGIETVLGNVMNVTWTVAGDIGNVKVEYFDGTSWTTATTTAPEAGPYAMTLNAPLTTVATMGARVRISDADDGTVSDTSSNDFVVRPHLLVLTPGGSEAWEVGSTHNITWEAIGSNTANVKIEYSTDNGATYPNVIAGSTPNDGSFGWLIPDNIQSVQNMKVRMQTLPATDPWSVTAASNGLFQIIGKLQLTQPGDTTGVKWRINSSGNEIKWNATGSIVNVKLEYSTNGLTGPWSTIVSSTPSGSGNDKSYSWTIPSNFPIVKDNFRVRVLDAANTNVYDTADAASSTLANFTFVAPVSGNVWVAESSQTITWTTPVNGLPANVKIEYNLNDGSGWQLLPESDGTPNDGIVTNSGSRSWTLGTGLSAVARVRISDALDSDSLITSDAFKIRGSLTMTAPNTGIESWEINTFNNINWTKKGNITAVRLEFSNNGDDPASYEPLVDADGKDTQNIDTTGPGPYTFNWRIPDQPGITTTSARVRVLDASDPTVYDPANFNFTIKGRVSLTTPNGGETLGVGTPYAVSGSVFGPITSVKLYYSTNGGLTYDYAMEGCSVVAVAGGAFSCNWSVPDKIGSNLRVKVEDANNPLVFDVSDANFSIKGSAVITAPISTSVWGAGESRNIIWNANGTIGNVDLFYSNDGGTNWTTIASGVATTLAVGNTFNWTLPTDNIVSLNVKVKLQGNGLIAPAISDAFTVKGKITLTYPDAAGIETTLGGTLNVTWTRAGDIGPVKVEYYDGTSWSLITMSAPQDGPYAMLLDAPNTTLATAGALIRVSDPDDATVSDTSSNAFKVLPLLQVTAPAGGESWKVSDTHNITWNFKGTNVATVKIDYSKDGGVTYNDVIAASTANDGDFAWLIPDSITAAPSVKVRISSLPEADLFAVRAVSNGLFKIIGGLLLSSPTGTDKWGVGTAHDIKWTRTGSVANVRLDYSTDNGTTWNQIAGSVPGGQGDTGYTWTVPNAAGIVSTTVKARVSDVTDASVFNVSPTFSITPSFIITAPALGQNVPVNKNFTIAWTRQGQNPTVNLYYSKDGFSGPGIPIALGASNNGSYAWAVPDFAELSTGPLPLQVRVAYPADETAYDDSDVFHAVAGFTVVSPNAASDKWDVGSAQTIRWKSTSANSPQAKIRYSVDGGATFPFTLTSTAGNSGAPDAERTWSWPSVPDTITSQFKVRVEDANDATAFDDSDANAKIKAYFEVLTPSAVNITATVGSTYNITWGWEGTVTDVLLSYSKDNFATSSTINGGLPTANDGVYEWTVPDDITSSPLVKVRVRSSLDSDAVDISDNAFKIRGNFTITKPNGTDRFKIGLSDTIQWTTVGNIPNVRVVAYSTLPGDTGFPYTAAAPLVIANSVANVPNGNKTYTWSPIPNMPSANLRVRVLDVNDTTVYDDSDADFRIQGQFTATNPMFTAVPVGSTQTITWTWGGSMPNAVIEYSVDGGAYVPIQENEGTPNDGIVTNDGSFDWVVPDTISADVRIRIRDPFDNEVQSVTNPFKIHGFLDWTFAQPAQKWVVNENHALTWTSTGSIPNVLIEVSTNNGMNWSPIKENEGTANDGIVPNTGTYTWNIPDTPSPTVKLRISDPNDPTTVKDVTGFTFTIDYYYITWQVRDLLTNNSLDQLTVSSSDGWNASALNSPVVHGHPAGTYVATWTRVEYGDQQVNFVADSDQTVTIFMETQVVHLWESVTELAYNAAADTVSIASTLRRDGSTVSGVVSCTIQFYDAGTLIKQFDNNGAPDAQGFYNFNWAAPTGLQSGKVYNVVTTMSIASGGVFKTPRTFNITDTKKLEEVSSEVASKIDVPLSQVRDSISNTVTNQLSAQSVVIQGQLDAQTTALSSQLNNQTSLVSNKLDQQTTIIQTQMNTLTGSLVSLENATTEVQNATDDVKSATSDLEETNMKFAGRLLIPTSVLLGDDFVIRYRGGKTGLIPFLRVLSNEGEPILQQQPMKPVPDVEGLYEYVFPRISTAEFTAGKAVTVMVEENETGNFEAGSVFIESTTLSEVQGLVAAGMGKSKELQEISEQIKGVSNVVSEKGYIGQMLEALKKQVTEIPEVLRKDRSNKKMQNQIQEVAEQISTLAGDKGLNLGELMDVSVQEGLEQSPSLREIRKRSDKMQGAIEVVQQTIERELVNDETPIVEVVYS
ncbi:MAG TPA: hypothetical protein VL688_06230 [Verrucomicrobiae bacterium]|nr:hypothetical protein [Verrucomicrobiae bacterium]